MLPGCNACCEFGLLPSSPLFKLLTCPENEYTHDETFFQSLRHQIFILKYMKTKVNFVKILFSHFLAFRVKP